MDKSNRYAVRLADGTLIGPVDLHKVKQLLRSGQVTMHDRIALIGETFLPISEYPELTAIAANSGAHPPMHNHTHVWGSDDEEDVFAGLQPIRVFFPDPEEPDTAQVAQYSGMLEKVPFSSLFYFFFSRNQTGRLLLKGPQHTREIFFEKGIPQTIELLTETDDLEQRLLMRRACTLEQLSQGLQKLASLSGSLGNHLIALGFIDPYLLYEVLQEQFRDQLLSCFSWLEGRYFFFVNERPKKTEIPFRVECLDTLKQGIYKNCDLQRLQWALEPYYNRPVNKTPNPQVNIEQLSLSPQEARVYNFVGRTETLWELIQKVIRMGVADQLSAHQFLFFLGRVELLLFDGKFLGPRIQDEIRLLEGHSLSSSS